MYPGAEAGRILREQARRMARVRGALLMSRKVFVGGLPWATDDASLRDFFAECGEVVEAQVLLDRATGRSRGFGFVTFRSADDAQRALSLDGQSLDGRNIKVELAEERERSGGGGDRGGRDDRGGRGGRDDRGGRGGRDDRW
jgi:heterogeneous nuclear ribonucleoprotein A1/A3